MVPAWSAKFGFGYNTTGVIITTIAIISGSNDVFKIGVSFLVFGAIFVAKDIVYMINFK